MTDPVVIFDVGNVILTFDPMPACRRLAALCRLTAEQVCADIYARKLERKFEEGKISGKQFAEGVREILGVDLSLTQLQTIWTDIFDENRAVSNLVRRIKRHHRVMLLSNTNQWHWEFAADNFPIIREVPEWILSYEIGVLKPHPLIYETALKLVGSPKQVIFIDDIETNVEGAIAAGMIGIRFTNLDQLQQDLTQLSVNSLP